MERSQFTFYRSYFEAVKALPKKDQAAVLLAVCAYALDSEEPILSGTASAIFRLIRPTLDTGRRKAMGGMKRSLAKDGEKNAERPREDTSKITERQREDTAKEKEIEIELERDIENECYPPTPLSGETRKKHMHPTVDEVSAYCEERHNGIDAQAFVDFYSAKGWLIGKAPMKDWKAAVRTWEKRKQEEQPQRKVLT